MNVEIRDLGALEVSELTEAFCGPGWNKPADQYTRYLAQHDEGEIRCLVAYADGQLAGYLKIVWTPAYPVFRDEGVPEIQDLNVLDAFRRRGVASRLLDRAEAEVARRSAVVGIGFGLHPGYNAAQRLYILRGYVPDGHGVTYDERFVDEGEVVPFDDRLVLHLTKELRTQEGMTP